MPKAPVIDPWLLDSSGNPDPFAGTIDFSMRPEDEINPDAPALDQIPDLDPQIVTTPPAEVPPDPAAIVPPPDDPSERIDLKDGGFVLLEKEKGQWKATLDPDNGANPEVFWGKNKNELLTNALAAKLNATKKIRELNRKVKFNDTPRQAPVPVVTPQVRELSADESIEIKLQLESNPDLAFSNWFQKKTGMSVNQLVSLAQDGSRAKADLEIEGVSRAFLANNSDYYKDDRNFELLLKWLAKFRLGKVMNQNNTNELLYELQSTGNYTVENLEEAFADLSSDGELVKAPKAPKPNPPVTVEPQPAPAPRPDDRIVQTVTRPRAGLGIRPSDVTPVAAPEAQRPPSVEELDDLPDDQIKSLLAGVRRQKILARRSN